MEKTVIGLLAAGMIGLVFKIIWDWLKNNKSNILIEDISNIKSDIKDIHDKINKLIERLLDEYLKKEEFFEYKERINKHDREIESLKTSYDFLRNNLKSGKRKL